MSPDLTLIDSHKFLMAGRLSNSNILVFYMVQCLPCKKLETKLKTFSVKKRHKRTFSLVFLLKIGKLHFSLIISETRLAPLLQFLLFAMFICRQIIHIKNFKNSKTFT